MKEREFRLLVAEMRRAQKRYFRNRSSEYLNQSMTLERQVDNELLNDTEPELPFS